MVLFGATEAEKAQPDYLNDHLSCSRIKPWNVSAKRP